jgi:hypothetical protein
VAYIELLIGENTSETANKQLDARGGCFDALTAASEDGPYKACGELTMSETVQSLVQAGGAARETVAESDLGFLWDFWYPAGYNVYRSEVSGQKY